LLAGEPICRAGIALQMKEFPGKAEAGLAPGNFLSPKAPAVDQTSVARQGAGVKPDVRSKGKDQRAEKRHGGSQGL
jgi:hypothetical protein